MYERKAATRITARQIRLHSALIGSSLIHFTRTRHRLVFARHCESLHSMHGCARANYRPVWRTRVSWTDSVGLLIASKPSPSEGLDRSKRHRCKTSQPQTKVSGLRVGILARTIVWAHQIEFNLLKLSHEFPAKLSATGTLALHFIWRGHKFIRWRSRIFSGELVGMWWIFWSLDCIWCRRWN